MNNIAPKPPLARQANNMAGYGRYGDSQLVHMNPYEVQGLAAMSPTGQLTTNPTTGQPEAFLPFLAPLIAPMLGSALGTAAFGGAIGSAAAGAIGSGLATWAATGDFEKGVVGGLTGFGLGQVLGAGADAAKLGTEVGNVAAAQTGLAEATKAAAYSPDLAQAGEYLQGVNPMANAQTMGSAMAGPPAVAQGIFPGDISGGMTASTSIPAGQQGFLNASQNLGTAQSSLASARAGLGPAQRLSGLASPDGLKAMGKQALSPSSMLPIGVGLGTQAQLAQQDDMEALRKEKLGEDRAYAQEFEDVLGNAIGVSNRNNQRQGRPTSTNPYSGQYAATGGVVGMDTGGSTTGGAHDHPHDEARGQYLDSINDAIFLGDNPNATILNSSFVPGANAGNTFVPPGGGGAGQLIAGEGSDALTFQNEIGGTVASTPAGVGAIVGAGGDLSNITTEDAETAGAITDAWQDQMGGTINNATSGIRDGRYFVDAKAGTGAERQSFLKGDFKQDPPTDYRHGFEKEFQFFDYVKDREVDRELDAFGSGPSDYLAGLLGVDASTLARLGTPTAPGTNPLNTYTTTKGDQFSGVDNFSDYGVTDLGAAADYDATVDTVAGGGDYDGTATAGNTKFTQAQLNAQAETKRLADLAEKKRLADLTETERLAEIETKRLADLAEAKRLADLAEAKRLADIETARIAAAEAAAQRQADFTAELDALNIDVDGEYIDEEGDLVYDVMQGYAGLPSINETVASYYAPEDQFDAGVVGEAVTEIADRRTLAATQTENLAAQFQGDVAAQSTDDIAAIVQGISSGDFTVDQVAAQFGLPAADVQAAYESMTAATGGRMASGGQAGTKRFMTSMGPIELAGGGIAEIPVNQEFMQEMPPEMAMVQEQVIAEEPLDTDYNELIALTVEAIRGNIKNPDAVINMFIEEYGQERFLELRTAVLQSIVPNAQTEGLIAGSGSGMDDEVMGMIGENQPVAVSPGEYIVAADVLSGLGDGNSDAGADVMDEVQANVRMARSGGRQPAPIDLSRIMPA